MYAVPAVDKPLAAGRAGWGSGSGLVDGWVCRGFGEGVGCGNDWRIRGFSRVGWVVGYYEWLWVG